MKWWHYIALGVLITIGFVVIPALVVLIIILYIIYRVRKWVIRIRTPKGMRIKHKLLSGYLENKYGKKEGKHIYSDMIKELKQKGYR